MDLHTSFLRTRAPNTLPLVAAAWATLIGVYLLIAATRDRSFAIITFPSDPPSTLEVVKNKLLDYASVVAVVDFDSASGLFFPTLLALGSLVTRKYRRAALLLTGGLTLAICLIWPFSIGILYLPSAVLLLFAALRTNADLARAKR